MQKNLLFEIGTEELPAGYIGPALRQMAEVLEKGLKEAGLSFGQIVTTATHRRLVAFVQGLADKQESRVEEIFGPSAQVAFDKAGKPTKAAIGFARSQGISVEQIVLRDTPKGKYCVVIKKVEGKPAMELLPEILLACIKGITFPKTMYWLAPNFRFARPIRSILALLDEDVVPLEVNGVRSGRMTYGHPFESPGQIAIPSADFELYKRVLRERKVIVDAAERRSMIEKALTERLQQYGSTLREEELLDDVNNLVEYPCVVEGSFADEFLTVPACVLEAAMMEHQRYFPVRVGERTRSTASNAKVDDLLPRFLVVANRARATDLIRVGNERVLRARLADARFFWEEDKKTRLADRVERLKGVHFLRGLGTYFDKTRRLEVLTESIARSVRLSEEEIAAVRRAAHLAKADLVTLMVGEFPSLQGRMGGEYARVDGEPPLVYEAIADQYLPRTATSPLPRSRVGAVLSMADKCDNLAGCFALDLIPSGSQDPFALRRQSQAVLRLIEANSFHLSLEATLKKALTGLPDNVQKSDKVLVAMLDFFRDRIYQMSLDAGYRYDIVNAVLAVGFDDVTEFFRRLRVLTAISQTEIWDGLVEVVERTFNIGKKAQIQGEVSDALLKAPEEKALWSLYTAHAREIADLVNARDYERASQRYYEIFATPVHVFFDKVYVNVEDAAVRNNRLLMLRKINELYSQGIADLSKIVVERKA